MIYAGGLLGQWNIWEVEWLDMWLRLEGIGGRQEVRTEFWWGNPLEPVPLEDRGGEERFKSREGVGKWMGVAQDRIL